MERKYERPAFMSASTTQAAYDRWLQRKAEAHIIRDRKRGNTVGSVSSYKQAIHRAVVLSQGKDFYTGEQLNWALISTYDNEASKSGRTLYKLDFALLLSVDHYGNGLCTGDFRICAWRTNDAKSDLNHDEFVALCLRVVEYHLFNPVGSVHG